MTLGSSGGPGGLCGALGQLWEALAELWEALGELWEGLEELWKSSGRLYIYKLAGNPCFYKKRSIIEEYKTPEGAAHRKPILLRFSL